jgi:cell wall-associated NlpC family hydrolase
MMDSRAQRRIDFYRDPPLSGRGRKKRHDSLADEPAPGTQLFVCRAGYRHHGIYVGNGRIIQYAGRISYARGLVEEVSVTEFASGRAIRMGRLPIGPFDGEEIVRRARSRLGERRYELLRNNCEHFCNWCQLGESRSSQVERLTWLSRLLRAPLQRLRMSLRSWRDGKAPVSSAVAAE